jgi:UDP-N-acetylglucosamine 2-epimerase
MKIVSIVGARPQFVKLGPLSRELRKHHEEIIIHTGQHYDSGMSDSFFDQLEIPKPDINLEIGSGNHGFQTGKMLIALELELSKIQPDVLVSFGDTNSTLAACLTASKMGINSVHVEAGLRSFNRNMPEEINRIVADHTSDLLFAPTKTAMDHLASEGLQLKAHLTGDIMVDAFNFVQNKVNIDFLETEGIPESFSLLTLHRPYNVDDVSNLEIIFNKLGSIEETFVFPIHPRTRKIIDINSIQPPENFILIPPQGFIQFQTLLKYAQKVVTDSGGVQKEAYIAGKPCITLRTETEWVETVEIGWNFLADYKLEMFVDDYNRFKPTSTRIDLYGINVAEKMVNLISKII